MFRLFNLVFKQERQATRENKAFKKNYCDALEIDKAPILDGRQSIKKIK